MNMKRAFNLNCCFTAMARSHRRNAHRISGEEQEFSRSPTCPGRRKCRVAAGGRVAEKNYANPRRLRQSKAPPLRRPIRSRPRK